MSVLNLFPARIPFINLFDGTLTTEAKRALLIVQERSGGILGAGISPPVVLTASSSPYSYTTIVAGSIIVDGGTVTKIQYIRGSASITLAVLNGKLELQPSDTVKVTYTVAPTLTFLPQ